MPHFDSVLADFKGEKKFLRLQLEEGESIKKSIPVAMIENKVKEARVEEINGELKSIMLNFFRGNRFDSKKLQNVRVLRASGNFKESFGELYGSCNVSIQQKPPLTGTLVDAIAGKDTELVLSFIEIKPNPDKV